MKAGWRTVSMGQLCSIQSGKSDTKDAVADGQYAFFDRSKKVKRSSRYIRDCEALIIPGEGTEFLPRHFHGKFDLHQRAYALSDFSDSIDVKFLFHYLFHVADYFPRVAVGATVKSLRLRHFEQLPVVIPSIPEQHRIVAILDEAFDGIATARANAEQNLQNARALFESHLQSVFSQRGEGWKETNKPLSSLCELIVDCEHKTAPTQEEGIPSIRTPNIGKGHLLLDGVYRVSEATYTEWTRRAEPRAGDLIFAREAPAGNVGVVPSNLRVCLGQRTVLIRPNVSVFIPDFLALLLLCPTMQQTLLGHSRGATVQHVNMKDIRALNVGAIPSLLVQAEIVEKFASLRSETQRLESIYQRKLAALDALKKSLLHQAFSGAL